MPKNKRKSGSDTEDILNALKETFQILTPKIRSQSKALVSSYTDIGRIAGRLTFNENGHEINCMRVGSSGTNIPININNVTDVSSDALFILLVENDSHTLFKLVEAGFYKRFPCIVVTTHGEANVYTRSFLCKLVEELHLPVLALLHSSPENLKKMFVYGCGIKWLGVRLSDIEKYDIGDCTHQMTDDDIKTGKKLLKNKKFVKNHSGWVEELENMLETKSNLRLEALSTLGYSINALTNIYLPSKLKEQDWL